MKILLPDSLSNQLVDALKGAGRREVGGILMGEYIDTNMFRIKAVTVQLNEGTVFSFRRLVQNALAPLRQFFARTGHDYKRFNYLGEWHSHPSFKLTPSNTDSQAMLDIVQDPCVGANFAVLLIVKLDKFDQLMANAFVYLADRKHFPAQIVWERLP